jgi:hypothetical protein
LGISFEEGKVVGSVHPDDFRKAYKRIIEDIASGEIDTRELNSRNKIETYLDKLRPLTPKRQGSFTSDTLLGQEELSATTRAGSSLPQQRISRTPSCLIPRTFKCFLRAPRIQAILDELHRLKVANFENAVAVVIRIFIELAIYNYLESSGQLKQLIARIDKGGKKGNTWSPTLRQMLRYLLDHDAAIELPPQMRKALNKAVSDDDHPLSLDGMDQFVHNAYVAPTEKQLRMLWNVFERLMAYLMIEHSSDRPGKAK